MSDKSKPRDILQKYQGNENKEKTKKLEDCKKLRILGVLASILQQIMDNNRRKLGKSK